MTHISARTLLALHDETKVQQIKLPMHPKEMTYRTGRVATLLLKIGGI